MYTTQKVSLDIRNWGARREGNNIRTRQKASSVPDTMSLFCDVSVHALG